MGSWRNTFLNPPDEFSPVPFWFWNDALDKHEIARQMTDFRSKGITAFVLHPRIGLPRQIAYLSDTFLAFVRFAVEEAQRHGMRVCLYDEGMYPSGSAHGQVVKTNPAWASRGLRMIDLSDLQADDQVLRLDDGENILSIQTVAKGPDGVLDLSQTQILDATLWPDHLPRRDTPFRSILVFVETFSGGIIRGLHKGEDENDPNAPASADLLNPQAVEAFIHLTHDRYYQSLHPHFGKTIFGFFTDEPNPLGKRPCSGLLPWTPTFWEDFQASGGRQIDLPALWFDVGPETKAIRRRFRLAVMKRLDRSFYQPLARWCTDHGVALIGHPRDPMEVGLLKTFHIPGNDIVWRWVAPENDTGLIGPESTQAKATADTARHLGKRRNANECFGACGRNGIGWHLTGDDLKWYLDWLLVRGVNLILPHAFYYSLRAARANERPPDVGPNNIWWPYYRQWVNYIKRLCWLQTDSINQAPIAVLCHENDLPWRLAKLLYQNQIEFNYLVDALLDTACRIENNRILIHNQSYERLLGESLDDFDKPVVDRLAELSRQGGRVQIVHAGSEVDISTLKPLSSLILHPAHPDLRMTHLVKDEAHYFLLTNEGEDDIRGKLTLEPSGTVDALDAWEGTIKRVFPINADANQMTLPICLSRRDSIIYRIDPESPIPVPAKMVESHLPVAEPIHLNNDWMVFHGETQITVEKPLTNWTTWPGHEHFSGTLRFETVFHVTHNARERMTTLNLGQVHELAKVILNGHQVGVQMWQPYTFDITQCLHSGRNRLQVEVTNSLANRMNHRQTPSGLLGPIILA